MDFNTIARNFAISLPGFLLAITCHEAAHALMALKFGDDTAKHQGRISLNPMDHIDLFGTIIFPLIGVVAGGVPFGWAKPVYSNPSRYKNIKWGIFWVSFAGPLANLLLGVVSAFFCAVIFRFVPHNSGFFQVLFEIFRQSILINLVLAAFNLIPLPPLDGAKMLSTFLPYEMARSFEELQNFSFLFLILLWTTPIFSFIVSPFLFAGNWFLNFFLILLR